MISAPGAFVSTWLPFYWAASKKPLSHLQAFHPPRLAGHASGAMCARSAVFDAPVKRAAADRQEGERAMPELQEVEAVRRVLEPQLRGQAIQRIPARRSRTHILFFSWKAAGNYGSPIPAALDGSGCCKRERPADTPGWRAVNKKRCFASGN